MTNWFLGPVWLIFIIKLPTKSDLSSHFQNQVLLALIASPTLKDHAISSYAGEKTSEKFPSSH